jgi:L-alanine-DL-glutamate epimerase-like enolase superfamily enzyme
MTHITNLRFVRVHGTWHYDGVLGEGRSASPAHLYPELRSTRRRWPIPTVEGGPPYPVEALFLFVDTDAGVSGCYGPLPESEARIIATRLVGTLIGEDPHAVERIWDKLYRTNVTGRKGETMQAISKVDLALWDLKGKLLGVPVYVLLGGPTRDRVPAYASMLGYDQTPERAAQHSSEAVSQGYTAIKWFLSYTPQDGQEGMRRNLATIRAVREAVGPDVRIMFDAWKSWDVPYSLRMAALAAPYRPWWFEEPVMPDLIDQYAEIRRTVETTAISGGEHEYTRWGIKALLDAGAVDILQPDPTWVGGLSEMLKICALASAQDIPVIPHHGGRASLHLIAAQPRAACPIQEWLFQAGRRNNLFIRSKIEPVDGFFELPTEPGLGMDLDDSTIESQDEIIF